MEAVNQQPGILPSSPEIEKMVKGLRDISGRSEGLRDALWFMAEAIGAREIEFAIHDNGIVYILDILGDQAEMIKKIATGENA